MKVIIYESYLKLRFPYHFLLARQGFTNEIDWKKVYDGVFNPQNIATHNKRNLVNYMSGNVGWLLTSLSTNNDNVI